MDIEQAFKGFVKPWKQLEPLVTSIDQTYLEVKDIVQFCGHVEGHVALVTSQQTLATVQHLKNLLERLVNMSKPQDIVEMACDCRQRVEARLQQPARDTLERVTQDKKENEATDDLETLLEGVIVELQDCDEDCARQQCVLEQLPEMRSYRSKQRNILKVDRVMTWVEFTRSQLLWINGNNARKL